MLGSVDFDDELRAWAVEIDSLFNESGVAIGNDVADQRLGKNVSDEPSLIRRQGAGQEIREEIERWVEVAIGAAFDGASPFAIVRYQLPYGPLDIQIFRSVFAVANRTSQGVNKSAGGMSGRSALYEVLYDAGNGRPFAVYGAELLAPEKDEVASLIDIR